MHGRFCPLLSPFWRTVSLSRKSFNDLSDTHLLAGVPGKNLAHDLGCHFVNNQISTHTPLPWHAPVSIGDGGPENLALASAIKFAPPITFRQLGPFIFRNCPLNLN